MGDKSDIRDVADAVKGIAEAVPVYQDVVQPAAREVGTALQTVAKTIHIVLAPVSALVWGYDQIKDFVNTKVAEKLKDVPPENITSPKPNVAGPALESLKYTGHEEALRDMYANLLAASMDTRTADGAHPAFVEIIKQLTPDEAKIVRLFAVVRPFPLLNVRWDYKQETENEKGGMDVLVNFSLLGYEADCQFPEKGPTYIDNLCRLGLADIPTFFEYTAKDVYKPLEEHHTIQSLKKRMEDNPKVSVSLQRKGLRITELGKLFCRICAVSHEKKGLPTKSVKN